METAIHCRPPWPPRPSPGDCNLHDPTEIAALRNLVINAYCQSWATCGRPGPMPSWCEGNFIPPGQYGQPGVGTVMASTYCCCDRATMRCVGRIVAGPGWPKSKCKRLCIYEHEYTHKRHCETYFTPGSPTPPGYSRWTECQAWCNTLACALNLLRRGGVLPPYGITLQDGRTTCGPLFGGAPRIP